MSESAPPTSPARSPGVVRNSAYSLAAQLSTAGFTAILTVYLVRALGPARYGVFALAVGIGALLVLPSDFGISSSTARTRCSSSPSPADSAEEFAMRNHSRARSRSASFASRSAVSTTPGGTFVAA